MGNLEKSLIWVLVIVFLGSLFIANYKYNEEASSLKIIDKQIREICELLNLTP